MNINALKASLAMAGLSTKSFGEAMGWKKSTSYRKVNGSRPFTVPEVEKASRIINMTPEDVLRIFFTS